MTLLELLSRYTDLRKVANTDGGEYHGACPWCGGQDRFAVWPHGDRPHYWCRRCDKRGDAVQFLRDYERLSFAEACDRLGQRRPERAAPSTRPTPKAPPLARPPAERWQTQALALIARGEQALWTPAGAQARGYLHRRGLTEDTIRAARLGYQARDAWEEPTRWGLPADHPNVYLLRGLVLPWYVGGEVWRVLFRRDGEAVAKTERYKPIAGGRNALYGIDTVQPNRPAMLVEGVLDALSLQQEAGDLLAVVAGGTTGGRVERFIGRLALASVVLLGFDADDGGEAAAAWWQQTLGPRARRWVPLWDDANAMLQSGVDLRLWVREALMTGWPWWRELAAWPEARREVWAERAAMMEVEGGLSREAAEREAFALMVAAMGRET
jgi:hypothetical protein